MPKLNIMRSGGDYLNGYTNIAQSENPNYPDIQCGDATTLDWIADNGEMDEIIADKVLEQFPTEITDQVISNWVSKLRVGGKIVIGILDLYEVVRMAHFRLMTIEQFNNITFGKNNDRRSLLSTQQLIEKVCKPHSLKVVDHTLTGADSTITFERYK